MPLRPRVLPVLALAMVLLAGCASVPQLQPPAIALEQVELLELGFSQQRFGLTVQVDNPNAVALPVAGFRYGVTLSGIRLGEGQSTERVRVPARGTSRVQLELNLDTIRLLGQLSDWMRQPPSELSYLFDGEIDVDLWPRPLQFSRDGRVPIEIAPGAFGF